MTQTNRQKLAQLTSSVGAGVLGVGIGALASGVLGGIEAIVIAIGLGLHLWGKIDTRRVERGTRQPAWATATYWLCWAGLSALVVVMMIRALD
jgi:hypothetical protein